MHKLSFFLRVFFLRKDPFAPGWVALLCHPEGNLCRLASESRAAVAPRRMTSRALQALHFAPKSGLYHFLFTICGGARRSRSSADSHAFRPHARAVSLALGPGRLICCSVSVTYTHRPAAAASASLRFFVVLFELEGSFLVRWSGTFV